MNQKKEGSKIQNFAINRTVLFILLVMLVAVITSLGRNILCGIYGTTIEKQFIIMAICDILVSLLIVLPIIIKLDIKEKIGLCSRKGIGKGLLLVSIDLVCMIIYAYITLLGVYKFEYQYAGFGMLFWNSWSFIANTHKKVGRYQKCCYKGGLDHFDYIWIITWN